MKQLITTFFAIFFLSSCVVGLPASNYSFGIKKAELSDVKRFNFMPKVHKGYRNVFLQAYDQQGRTIHLRKLIKRSNREKIARNYVKEGLAQIHKLWVGNKVKSGDLSLAEYTTSYFHQAISRDLGSGKYSTKHEVYPNGPQSNSAGRIMLYRASSVQTLSEFFGNGFEGDSFDFSVALTSIYEIARSICKWKREQFYRQLYSELQRYQVVSLAVQEAFDKRYLNAVIRYNGSMTKAELMPLDPMWHGKKKSRAFIGSSRAISFVEGGVPHSC